MQLGTSHDNMILIQGTLLSRNYFSGSYSNSAWPKFLMSLTVLMRVTFHVSSSSSAGCLCTAVSMPLIFIACQSCGANMDLYLAFLCVMICVFQVRMSHPPYSQRLQSDHSPFSAISKTLTTREAVVLRHSNWQGY